MIKIVMLALGVLLLANQHVKISWPGYHSNLTVCYLSESSLAMVCQFMDLKLDCKLLINKR